jgi:hypothetical protein
MSHLNRGAEIGSFVRTQRLHAKQFFSWKRVAAGLVLLGLILTVVGAAIAASGVILSPEHAKELASTKWGENDELRVALLDQSARAMWGLIVIAIGTGMQLVGTIIPLIKED